MHHKHCQKKWPKIAELILSMVKADPTERISLGGTSRIRKDIKEDLSKDHHFGIECDGCKLNPIVGIRYRCKECPDFDFCETCKTNVEHDPAHTFEQLNEKETFKRRLHSFLIKTVIEEAEQIIYKFKCYKCGKRIKTETAHACQTCKNAFYCKDCFAGSKKHTKIHTFEVVTVNPDEEIEGTSSRAKIVQRMCSLILNVLRDQIEDS